MTIMALSLLQDTAPKKGLAAVARLGHGVMKETQGEDPEVITNNNNNINNNNKNNDNNRNLSAFPSGLLTAGQLFPAALMSPALALHAGSLFHHSQVLTGWAQQQQGTHSNMQVKTNQSKSSAKSSTSSSSRLKKDMLIVDDNNQPPLSPPTSGSSPQSNSSSGQEISTRGDNREKVFTCGICNRSFGYKHVLQNHERTHTGEKPFECNQCHKRFTRDHHLKTHMRLHTGEKPYHCTHCDRHFVQVANLRRHLRVHTGERPYACELCSSRFSDSNQLKAHMLIHKGEKPFQCLKCLGRFRRRHHLMHHKCSQNNNKNNKKDDSNVISTTTPVISRISHDDDIGMAEEHREISKQKWPLSRISSSNKSDNDADEDEEIDESVIDFGKNTRTSSIKKIPARVNLDRYQNLDAEDDDNLDYFEVDSNEIYDEDDDHDLIKQHRHQSSDQKINYNIIEKRQRKSRDIRKIIRIPEINPQIPQPPTHHQLPPTIQIPTILPEQTEPEDLSLSKTKRVDNNSHHTNIKLIHNEDKHTISSWHQRHPKFRRHLTPPLS